jgi:hypothetical protein
MVEVRSVSEGAGVEDGGGEAGGGEAEVAASAVGGATFTGGATFLGDSGSGGVGGIGGESGSIGGVGCSSSGDAGSRVGESRGEELRGAGGVEFDGGVGCWRGLAEGGVGDGDVHRLGRGERRKSLSSSQSRKSSSSFRLFLVLFTGGGAVSGDKGEGPTAGDGAAGVGAAGVAVGGVDTRAEAMAALARLWRRR